MSSLRALAKSITELADQLETYRESVNPEKSNERQWLQALPNDLAKARLDLVDQLHEMIRESQSVESRLYDLFISHAEIVTLLLIYNLKLPQQIPPSESVSYSALARSCNVEEDGLRRIVRFAITNRMFAENQPGLVSHTDLSLLLRDPDAFDTVGMTLYEMLPAFLKLPEAFQKYPKSSEPEETAYSLANNTELPMYRFMEQHPERARRFGGAMMHLAHGDEVDLRYLLDAFPWSDYDREGTVLVDVGGGHGHVAAYLAERTSNLRFVVQDLKDTADMGEKLLPVALKPKVEFQTYDFMKEQQPIKNAQIYFFKNVFHNWSDKYCVEILKAHVPALKEGAKVLLYEYVLGDVPVGKWSRKMTSLVDMLMLTLFNGGLRSDSHWQRLFKQVDERFVFEGVHRIGGSALNLVEFTFSPQTP